MTSASVPPSRFEVLRGELRTLVVELAETAHDRGATTSAHRLEAAGRYLDEAQLTVLVCGEFKRGKSSLLNAFLEERPVLFPVDARVATRVVTTASWGAVERIEVISNGPDGAIERRVIGRAEIADHAAEFGDRDHAIGTIEVQIPSPRLTGGLTLVDTPGVGGVFREHTAVTMGFLPRADAVVFVTDFTQPMLAGELDFLRQATAATRLAGDPDAMLFVVTKADVVDAAERGAMLANTAEKVARATGEPVDTLTILPVSSLTKLDFLASGDPTDLADSGFERLEAELAHTVERRRAVVILGAALAEADSAVTALLRPLDDEHAALEAGTRRRLDELEGQAALRQAELASLQQGQASWRTELHSSLQLVGKSLQRDARHQLAQMWHRCDNTYLYSAPYLAEPDRLVERLAADVAQIAGSLGELAEQHAARVLQEFAVRNRLALSQPSIAALPPPRVPPMTITGGLGAAPGRSRLWDGAKEFTQGNSIGGSLGRIVGSLIGSLGGPAGMWLGAFVGEVIGGLAGGAQSVREAVDQQRHADETARRECIQRELAPLRGAQEYDIDVNLDILVHNLVIAVGSELDERLAQEQESLVDAVARLTETRRATTRQAATRRESIDWERVPLMDMQRRLARIGTAASGLGSRRPGAR